MVMKLLKIALVLVALLLLVSGGVVAVGMSRWDRTFEAAEPAITASTDSAVIARGAYIVNGPGRCLECHTNSAGADTVRAGGLPALAGGMEFPTPVGTFITPNITPHQTLGIGRYTDGQLARALRNGVRHDGRVLIPFMEVQNLSDADLRAVISYLRAQPPVEREVPDHRPNFLGKMVLAFVIKPEGPQGTPPAESPAESATVERGRYIADAVATCGGCHTKRSKNDGSYIGERYAGGGEFFMDSGLVFMSPNLTPAQTGKITGWTEDQFVERFRMGPLLPGTPMPWRAFQRMSEADMRALYRYLKTLAPVENDPGPVMREASAN